MRRPPGLTHYVQRLNKSSCASTCHVKEHKISRLDITTLAYTSSRVLASYFVLLPIKPNFLYFSGDSDTEQVNATCIHCRPKDAATEKHFRETEAFGANSEDVTTYNCITRMIQHGESLQVFRSQESRLNAGHHRKFLRARIGVDVPGVNKLVPGNC